MSKRLLAFALSVIMLVSLMAPFSALAAESDLGVTSGECGEGLSWNYNSGSGTLTVSGNGYMDDYSSKENVAPWKHLNKYIYFIEVEEGVKSIGDWAFSYCYYAKMIELPESGLERIGQSAFYQCAAVEEILIPETVTSIGSGAFAYCKNLISVSVPVNVKNIRVYAFCECVNLSTIYYAGTQSQWNMMTIDPSNVEQIENISLVFDTVTGISWSLDEEGTLTVSGIGRIDNCTPHTAPWSDYETDIKKIVIEEGVTGIGNYAFGYCFNLKEVVFPDTLTYIGSGVFYKCYALETINLPESVTRISSGAFYDCKSLNNVVIPSGIETIYVYTFDGCNSLTDVSFNGTQAQWQRVNVLAHNETLSAIKYLKESVTWSFDEQTGVLTISGSVPMDDYNASTVPVAPWSEHKDAIKTVVIKDGVTSIGSYAFYNCANLTEVAIPESVTSIGNNAFHNCYALDNVVLPETVKTLGGGAFYNNSSMTDITVPASITNINSYSFSGCDKLETVYYTGTEAQFEAITVSVTENDAFINANVVFGNRIPEADVTELGATEVTYQGNTYLLDNAYSFKSTESFDVVNASSKYRYYHADFVVSFDKDVNDVVLAGYYKMYADHVGSEDWVPLTFENVKAGEQIRLLDEKWFAEDGSISYQELCVIKEFLCGVLDEDGDDEDTTMTVELRLYEVTENSPSTSVETGEYIVAGTYSYTFPEKVKIYSFDEQTGTLTLFGNGEDYEVGDAPFSKYAADIKTVNITTDVTVIGANAFADCTNIESVVYDGTRVQWNTLLNIGTGNDPLLNAERTYAIYQGEMFRKKFTEDFLYRIGNANAVKLGSLFEAADGVSIDSKTVEVTVRSLDESANASWTYTKNESDWTQSTIDFNGIGVVEISISDISLATTLKLEVINAKNVTSFGEMSNTNCVMLNDVDITDGAAYGLSNATLYGNGFTFDVTDGDYTASGYITGNYVILLGDNAGLDNVEIVGKVYTEYGATSKSDYNHANVLVNGENVTISNCYISNCAAPVRVCGGSVEIVNTTLKGGNFANLDIREGDVVLEDVTTINQISDNDVAEDGTKVIGFGITSYYENVPEGTTITIKGDLTQYNSFAKSDKQYLSDASVQNFATMMFGTEYSNYIYTDANGESWINLGIFSMMNTVSAEDIIDMRTSEHTYAGQTCVGYGKTGYIYAPKAAAPTSPAKAYVSDNYNSISPNYKFDYTTKNYIPVTEGSNEFCYYTNGKVNISFDYGNAFAWDPFILTASRATLSSVTEAEKLDYTVKMNGTEYTGNISFTESGEHTVEYTYTDPCNYTLDQNGDLVKYDKTYTKTVELSVATVKPNAKHAEFTFGSSNIASREVTAGNKTYVMPDVSATSSTIASKTVDGQTIYMPIVEVIMSDGKIKHTSGWYAYFPVFSGVVTITDYEEEGFGDPFSYGASTTAMPESLSVVGDPASVFIYSSASSAGSTPVVKNNILVYSSAKIEANRSEQNITVEYTYTDSAKQTYYYCVQYHAAAQTYSPCVTPETLITLADGSQKEVQHLTGDETLLVWNHETGKMDTAPIAYIVDHNGEVSERTVTTLYFENGKEIEIIGEHVFYNMDTDKYMTLDENANDFIGTTFAMQSADGIEGAKLVNVTNETRNTAAYEVVTYKNVTCFTNGVLSASAYLDKILNIFDIDEDTKAYVNAAEDIEKYGLYTYEDFEGLISEEAFELYNAKYLKIAVGKGYITWNDILDLIDIYFGVEVKPL
ncbi:MAG: leucine-rich repeat protein [Clostridia bacterium]|nr:leucine-rich repeat protein [Clostridia bacterium]